MGWAWARPVAASDTTAPAPVSFVVAASGARLDVTFDEALDEGSVPAAGDAALSGTNAVVTSTSVSGAVWSLHFSSPLYVTEGETVLVSYTPGTNKLRDAAHNNVAAITNHATTNGSDLPDQLTGADAVQTYSFTGASSGQLCEGRIYLPAGYTPASATLYPVMVVMHGKGGSSNGTAANALPEIKDAVTAGQLRKHIVIMPDSDGADFGMDATGQGTGTTLAETKIVDDVIPHVEARTRASGVRTGSGFSMGGYSILRIAMANVGLFVAVFILGAPNTDANPTSGTVNNWRYSNSTYTDTGANDGDDLRRMVGPTGSAPQIAATLAALEALSPFASKNGTGLANQHTAAIIAGLVIGIDKSAADAVTLAHMDKADEVLTSLAIPHTYVDLVTTGHFQNTYYQTAQGKSSIADGNLFMLLELALAGGDANPPQIVGSPVVNSAGTQVTITVDKALASNSPSASQFTFGGTYATVASASASGTTIVLTSNHIIAQGAAVTVSIASAAAAVKIQSAAGVPMAPRTAVSCTNNSTQTFLGQVSSVSFLGLYDDTHITNGSGTVSAWPDQSAASHSFSAAGAAQPTYDSTAGPRGAACLTFNGTAHTMSTGSYDIADPTITPFYAIAIIKQISYTSLRRLWSAPSGGMQLSQTGTTPALTQRNTTSVNSNTGAAVGSWARVSTKFTGSTSDELRAGSSTVTGASAGTTNPASGAFALGSAGGANFANFSICFFAKFAGVPNGTEIANMDKFLFGLYGSAVGF